MKLNLSKMLKFRLPTWKCEAYWKWCSSQRLDGYEWHHLLGRKYSDFLVVRIPIEQHKRIHARGYEDGEFEELLVQAMMWQMEYIIIKSEK